MGTQCKKVLLFSSAMVALGMSGGAKADEPGDLRSIVLFGASWCAPCRAELKDLPELVRAAAPYPVVLAWLDRRPLVKDMPGVIIVSTQEAAAMFGRLSKANQGLPLNVVLDRDGTACAELRERLHVAHVARFKASCAG